jgi:hypothetical protein
MTRAEENRETQIQGTKHRLSKRHSHVNFVRSTIKDAKEKRKTLLSVVIERKETYCESKRYETLQERVQKAREANLKVAEKVQKNQIEDVLRKEERLQEWESKIQRARDKRETLLRKRKGTI